MKSNNSRHRGNTMFRHSLVAMALCMTGQAQAAVGNLIWEENFDSLDSNIWNIDVGDGCNIGLCGWGNQELQWYAQDNVSIGKIQGEGNNKALILQARSENVGGKAFTSGKVTTQNNIAVQYGMIEVRMKSPEVGTGLWPAAWMLGTSTATWPAKGEIDMMEMGHSSAERARQNHPGADVNAYVGANLIFYSEDACSEGNPTCAASTAWDVDYDTPYIAPTSLADRFVTYRTYWTDTSIRFTVTDNGVEHDLYESPFTISEVSNEFQAPFYLLLNLAVGGTFTDAATNGQVNAPLPGNMMVDYIRVYEFDGQGEVFVGNVTNPEVGTFGVFTDTTTTNNQLEPGVSADIYIWDPNTSEGTEAPYEGSNVISWSHTTANTWFGGGVQARQAVDLSNFDDGELTFKLKIPADVAFKIGVTDTYTNEHWLEFPANTNQYGMVRDGDWSTVTIPVADLRGPSIAMQSLNYVFAIASVDGAIPATSFDFAIDDIVYTGGGAVADADGDGVMDSNDNCPNTPAGTTVDSNGCAIVAPVDSDNDGVEDSIDQCPNTPQGTEVDSVGCAVLVTDDVMIEAEDYSNYFDLTAGNTGGAYRSDDVDIEASTDTGGGYNVGWTDPSEWLEYSVELAAGTYNIDTRVASQVGGGAYELLINGNAIGSDTVGATGGWQGWETHNVGAFTVAQGIHTLRMNISGGLFNLNWLHITKAGAAADSDLDGVIDSNDLCPGTAAGATVDADGCEVVASFSGVTQTDDTSVEFYINNGAWADVHYLVNGVNQQNVRMTLAGGVNTHSVGNLANGDVITYWFTYLNDQSMVVDSAQATHTMGSVSGPVDSDGDGVDDGVDQCPNTPAGDTVDANGCTVVLDSDNDGVVDSLDQCPNTPAGASVDSNGCEVVANDYGLNQTSNSSVTFYVNRDDWADVHYKVNGGAQQNHRMSLSSGVNTQVVSNLVLGDVLSYYFTYLDDQGLAFDTPEQSYTMVDVNATLDSDNDGVIDSLDQCANTPAGTSVDSVGCPVIADADGDGVADGADLCPNTPAGTSVDSDGCAIVMPSDSDNDGVNDAMDLCPNTPAGATVDSTGCEVSLGNIVPLYDASTPLETAIVYDRGDAIVTQFADRARDRHAKEDQFQSYDHYLTLYWKHRTARFKFEDYVSKGGNAIVVTFVTEWRLGAREFRAWYYGMNTVAEYHGNYQNDVLEVASGTFDSDLNQVSTSGDQYKYQLTINQHRGLNGSIGALAVGQRMEIEVSQFLSGVPEGRANYYGTTYLYRVGEGGMVPWYTVGDFDDKSSERENSHELAQSAWLGGETTLPYGYTNEPDNHFMQMATNLAAENGQPFVLGRRIHHTDFETGQHDEAIENGIFPEMVGKAGPHYVEASCSGCHERNGRAVPADVGVPLEKWVFKVGDANGNPDPNMGRVLQPANDGINDATDGEGTVSIASWTENNGLRSPNYAFSKGAPATFSARIAPQLVGLGLLEAIKESDILALEDTTDANGDGISGKAQRVVDPVTGDTRIGRFGYKAATTSVKHQVAAAFNSDMGVMTSVLPNPDCGSAQTTCGSSGAELADSHLDNLVKYIALLGVRPQRDIDDAQVIAGQAKFNEIGCNGCHVQSFSTSDNHPFAELRSQNIQPYTDLLLHDMGPGLADNLGEGLATGSEWRTAPLWGLGLSACVTGGIINPTGGQGNEVCDAKPSYLHDGRARSIEEAILWHGGEGQASKAAYEALSSGDKMALLSFLNSL